MNPIKKIINSFRSSSHEEQSKQTNSFSNDFLRRGNLKVQRAEYLDRQMNPELQIRGWLYSSLNVRADSFAQFCEENLITESNVDDQSLEHPYLKLIENSSKQSEYEFWRDLISDYDIYGQAFIFVLRRVVYSDKQEIKEGAPKVKHLGAPVAIEALDAKNVTILRDTRDNIIGFREAVGNNKKREFLPEQVIYVCNHSPLDRKSPYSIFDACADYQYTINKGTEYAQAALINNINTPGILSTSEILNDEEYDNLISRINNHEPGKVIVSDGTGTIDYKPISQSLDATALPNLTEISRQTIFAVTGTSKTILGIEESGVTRETAKIQDRKFTKRTIAPIAHRFASALNFDYRSNYPEEYDRTHIKIETKAIYDASDTAEQFDVQKKLFDSVTEIVYSGYTKESAENFMYGDISFTDLELDATDAQEINGEADSINEDASQNASETSEDVSKLEDDKSTASVSQNDFDERMVNKWFRN